MKNFLINTLWIVILFFASCGPSAEEKRELEYQKKELAYEKKKLEYRESITALLKADKNIATYTNHQSDAQSTAMRKLDLSQCPPNFSAAYVDHLHAWEELAKLDNALIKLNSTDNINALLIEQIVYESTGTDDSPILNAVELDKKLRNQRIIASENIKTTWYEVERIAVTYGATLTH